MTSASSESPEAIAQGAPPEPWPRRLAIVLAVALLLWLLVCWPLLVGRETLFFRDLFGHFAPLKAAAAAALREGSIPAHNPARALGHPLRRDPVASAFYPTNLLYLVLPFWTAFNLHLCLHWLLAAVSMGPPRRALGAGREGAGLGPPP